METHNGPAKAATEWQGASDAFRDGWGVPSIRRDNGRHGLRSGQAGEPNGRVGLSCRAILGRLTHGAPCAAPKALETALLPCARMCRQRDVPQLCLATPEQNLTLEELCLAPEAIRGGSKKYITAGAQIPSEHYTREQRGTAGSESHCLHSAHATATTAEVTHGIPTC